MQQNRFFLNKLKYLRKQKPKSKMINLILENGMIQLFQTKGN